MNTLCLYCKRKAIKQTNKQTRKQPHKQTSKQASKQENTSAFVLLSLCVCA
jgi:hypothetical protein